MLMTSSFVCATLNLGRKKSTGTEPKTNFFIRSASITVKHLLFACPYFREVTSLNIFTRLHFRELSDLGR